MNITKATDFKIEVGYGKRVRRGGDASENPDFFIKPA